MNKIRLYHVSYNLNEPLDKLFSPRIPPTPMYEEDNTKKRICLSDSIEGCINAIGNEVFLSKACENSKDIIPIIVWKNDFNLDDKNLISWKYLYTNNLVPDAALTHEYWYLSDILMHGSPYKIMDIQETINHATTQLIIKPQYHETILNIFSMYGIVTKSIQDLDLCTLVNHWLPHHANPNLTNEILNTIKNTLQIEKKSEIDNPDVYRFMFSEDPKPEYIPDYSSQKIYNINCQKLFDFLKEQ